MKKSTTLLVMLFIALLTFNNYGQWKYKGKINFPIADSSIVQPFLCTTDDNGKLYVISSRSTTLSAHDAIYTLKNPTDTIMSKMIDYTAIGDTVNVKMLVGITHIKNSILVTAKINNYISPGGQSCGYYYIDGDTAQGTRYGYAPYLSGWGTFILGVSATKDSIVFAGTDYTKGIRVMNFSKKAKLSAYPAYIAPDNLNVEPGGPSTAGFDVIRDCAVLPNGDYFNPLTPFYTARNSKQTGELNGGIAMWTGGTQYNKMDTTANHQNYTPLRITDGDDFLKFGSSIPYGITCDKNNLLWVAGVDSTRRWVKGFVIDPVTGIATNTLELPSSKTLIDPDPTGAPMTGPCDVAFTPDGSTGYVIDAWSRCVYKFSFINDVKEEGLRPTQFRLDQNYPNPFNPSTVINYSVPTEQYVKISVTNILGQEVAVLVDGAVSAGNHQIRFDGSNLSNGVYLYTLKAGNATLTNKMVLIK